MIYSLLSILSPIHVQIFYTPCFVMQIKDRAFLDHHHACHPNYGQVIVKHGTLYCVPNMMPSCHPIFLEVDSLQTWHIASCAKHDASPSNPKQPFVSMIGWHGMQWSKSARPFATQCIHHKRSWLMEKDKKRITLNAGFSRQDDEEMLLVSNSCPFIAFGSDARGILFLARLI